jgi:hypothetical protein
LFLFVKLYISPFYILFFCKINVGHTVYILRWWRRGEEGGVPAAEPEMDLEGGGAGNDLNQLAGDDSLAGAVKGDRQLVNHLAYEKKKTG